jgi:hypothetical protein
MIIERHQLTKEQSNTYVGRRCIRDSIRTIYSSLNNIKEVVVPEADESEAKRADVLHAYLDSLKLMQENGYCTDIQCNFPKNKERLDVGDYVDFLARELTPYINKMFESYNGIIRLELILADGKVVCGECKLIDTEFKEIRHSIIKSTLYRMLEHMLVFLIYNSDEKL